MLTMEDDIRFLVASKGSHKFVGVEFTTDELCSYVMEVKVMRVIKEELSERLKRRLKKRKGYLAEHGHPWDDLDPEQAYDAGYLLGGQVGGAQIAFQIHWKSCSQREVVGKPVISLVMLMTDPTCPYCDEPLEIFQS